jgi:NAD(P)-dependent dehydrogenase (short-subunit alcohol dehydrogenase family)
MSSEGKLVALVSGSTSGIGAQIARRLHADGLNVCVSGRSASRGEALRDELGEGAHFVGADLDDDDASKQLVGAVVDRFGRLDVLVNNAAVDHTGPLLSASPAEIRSTLQTNTVAAILLLQAAARAMVDTGGGSIINITSRLASAGVPGLSIYTASKGAMLSLTRTAAIELAEHNIRVNAVAPGLTRTPMYDAWLAELPNADEMARGHAAAIPIGRIAEPDDVAAAVSFLASPAASYITGVSLPVDGGFLAK